MNGVDAESGIRLENLNRAQCVDSAMRPLPLDLVAHAISFLDITESEIDIRDAFARNARKWRRVRAMWIKASRVARTPYYDVTCRWGMCRRVNNRLHSLDDEPTVVFDNGTLMWYRRDRLHRGGDLPAITTRDRLCEWYRDGIRHRDGGAAVISHDELQFWYYQFGKLHRDDGPAIVLPYMESWYRFGKLHRDDGPAVRSYYEPRFEYAWYRNGIPYDPNKGACCVIFFKFESRGVCGYRGMPQLPLDIVAFCIAFLDIVWDEDTIRAAFAKERDWERICRVWLQHTRVERRKKTIGGNTCTRQYVNGTPHSFRGDAEPTMTWSYGTQIWYRAGREHRDDDLPAVIASGYRAWFLNGERHRDGGPAITVVNGSEWWYRYNKLHRDNDLPAIIDKNNGAEYWYRDGNLHRENDRPAAITRDHKIWYRHGVVHRDGDLPASVYTIGVCYWFRNGKLYRDAGKPAEVADPKLAHRYMRMA